MKIQKLKTRLENGIITNLKRLRKVTGYECWKKENGQSKVS